jgi:hypothetical protein
MKDETEGKLGVYVGEPLIEANMSTARPPHPLQSPEFEWPEFVYVRRDGSDTGTCAAAVCTSASPETARYLEGAKRRGEIGLGIQEMQGLPGAPHSYSLPYAPGSILATALPSDVIPELAEGLTPEDKDLALRVRANKDIDWSTLSLQGGDLGATFQPLLIDALGKPVVACWIPTGLREQRWYIIPRGCKWEPIRDWLIYKAIPEFVSEAANRVYQLASIEDKFRTEAERDASAALEAFDKRAETERGRLEAESETAESEANAVRVPLLYKAGDDLKGAVEIALRSCGFEVEDLDEKFGEPLSGDLLASFKGKHWLIDPKAATGSPSEDEVSSVAKHLNTWSELGRQEKLQHAILVWNHHTKRPPAARPSVPYSRKEFVQGVLPNLRVTVISSMALCRWWASGDCEGLISAVTGPIGQYGA